MPIRKGGIMDMTCDNCKHKDTCSQFERGKHACHWWERFIWGHITPR